MNITIIRMSHNLKKQTKLNISTTDQTRNLDESMIEEIHFKITIEEANTITNIKANLATSRNNNIKNMNITGLMIMSQKHCIKNMNTTMTRSRNLTTINTKNKATLITKNTRSKKTNIILPLHNRQFMATTDLGLKTAKKDKPILKTRLALTTTDPILGHITTN